MNTQDQTARPSFLRRAAGLMIRVILTLAFIATAGFAVQIGAQELSRRAEAAPAPEPAPAIPVAASPLKLEDGYDIQRAFVGQVEPQRTVDVSFELAGLLSEILVEEGDTVQAGDTLAIQDIALLSSEKQQLLASKAATEAQLRFALQSVERNERLDTQGLVTQANLDNSIAQRDELISRIAEIDAGIANVDIRITKATVTAPFDGRITARLVDGGETLSPGQPILELVQLSKPFVRIGVPLDIDATTLASAMIELASVNYDAKLVTLRPDIEPITRTRTAVFQIDTTEQPAFGQTARLILSETVEAKGLWLPLTSLKEGVRGQWTVLVVDPMGAVRSASVEILHAEANRVFVRGAFPVGTQLIKEGPQRVTVGQQVIAQADN